jgi:hypothetical protein
VLIRGFGGLAGRLGGLVVGGEQSPGIVAVVVLEFSLEVDASRLRPDLDVGRVHRLQDRREGVEGIEVDDAVARGVRVNGRERNWADAHVQLTVVIETPEAVPVPLQA